MERPFDLSRRLTACTTLLVLPMIAACGSKAGGSAGPAPTGTLAITITTPVGVTGAVSVTGPQSFHQTLSASQTFTRVPVGAYTITADSVVTPDSVIGSRTDTANFVDASVTVALNDTGRSSVTYALKQLRGVMLVSNDGGTSLYTYGSNVLRSSGKPTPADTIGGLTKPDGMAFDAAGNLWVANESSHKIDMYTPAQLAAGGDPTPARTLTATVDSLAFGLRFDRSGNLWLTSQQTLQAFSPTQLAAGGTQTAAIKITSGSLVNPVDMLFDSSGNAWVSESFNYQLLKFTASELASSGSRTPTVTIPRRTRDLSPSRPDWPLMRLGTCGSRTMATEPSSHTPRLSSRRAVARHRRLFSTLARAHCPGVSPGTGEGISGTAISATGRWACSPRRSWPRAGRRHRRSRLPAIFQRTYCSMRRCPFPVTASLARTSVGNPLPLLKWLWHDTAPRECPGWTTRRLSSAECSKGRRIASPLRAQRYVDPWECAHSQIHGRDRRD